MLWGGGAGMLVKFRQAFRRMPTNEMQIKLVMTFSVLSSAIALVMMISTNTFGKIHH